MKRNILRLIFSILLCLSSAAGASAQDTKAQEAKKARLEREIAIIDRQLSENASKSNAMLSNLTLVRKKISNRKELVAESDRQIRSYSDRIYLKQKQINKLQARVDTLSAHYSRLVLSAYKNRDARVWYMYMLASENIGQAFRRFGYFRNLSSQMNDEARKIRLAQDELEDEKMKLRALKKEAEAVRAERAKELEKLGKEEAESDRVVRQLKKSRKKYEAQLASKKKQVDALNREIERLVAEAMRARSGQGKTSSKDRKPVDLKLAAEFSKNQGKLPWPVDGPVVDKFGQQYHPVYKNLKLPFNNGINIAVSKGTEVKAVFDGVVSRIVVMPGYNQCVLVEHGSYFSFYCKLKSTSVKAGDKVKTGQAIGVIDTINGETQLHFQIWQNSKPQNPELWLR